MKKLDVEAPHEVMLTIDTNTGQNAVSQTKLFHETVGLTGIHANETGRRHGEGEGIFSVADQFPVSIPLHWCQQRLLLRLRPFPKADDFIESTCRGVNNDSLLNNVNKAYLSRWETGAAGVTFHMQPR